jgi:hypothetical protein
VLAWFWPSTLISVPRAARRATCSTARFSVTLIFSPENMAAWTCPPPFQVTTPRGICHLGIQRTRFCSSSAAWARSIRRSMVWCPDRRREYMAGCIHVRPSTPYLDGHILPRVVEEDAVRVDAQGSIPGGVLEEIPAVARQTLPPRVRCAVAPTNILTHRRCSCLTPATCPARARNAPVDSIPGMVAAQAWGESRDVSAPQHLTVFRVKEGKNGNGG